MSQISIRYFGILRELVGKREEMFSIDDSSNIVDLVKMLSVKHGKKFTEFVFDKKGSLRQGFAFAVNGDTIDESLLSKTRCKDVHEFVILPPISGG